MERPLNGIEKVEGLHPNVANRRAAVTERLQERRYELAGRTKSLCDRLVSEGASTKNRQARPVRLEESSHAVGSRKQRGVVSHGDFDRFNGR